MIQVLLLDWGGVMQADHTRYTSHYLAQKYNINEKEVFQTLVKYNDKYFMTERADRFSYEVAKNFPFGMEELDKLFTNIEPRQDLLALIKYLRKQGFIIALLSNQVEPRTRAIRNSLPEDTFDHWFFSNELGMKKPHQDIYKHAINVLKKPPDRIVFVDDKQENITAARKAGMHATLYTDTQALTEWLRKHDIIVHGF